MARRGVNPQKSAPAQLDRLGLPVAVLNHIPEVGGYFKNSLDILELCVRSLRENTSEPTSITVFDNASCDEVRSTLTTWVRSGLVDCVVLNSRNLGVGDGVLQAVRSSAPGKMLYTDGDIFYRPGWLAASLNVCEAFPNVGAIGARPVRASHFHTSATMAWVTTLPNDAVERGFLLPDSVIDEHARAVSASSSRLQQWKQTEDVRVSMEGVSAYVGASHMQLLLTPAGRAALRDVRTQRLMGVKRVVMDGPIDEAGLLRLSCTEPLIYHMGNALEEPWLREQLEAWRGETLKNASVAQTPSRFSGLFRTTLARKVLHRVYSKAFELYHR